MQLDRTEIVIRQRTLMEIMDLSVVVLRRHFRMICLCGLLLGLPLGVANVASTYWMLSEEAYMASENLANPEWAMWARHTWHLVLLWAIEFPIVSLPITLFLGSQIFFNPITLKEILRAMWAIAVPVVIVLGIARFGLLFLVSEWFVPHDVAWSGLEVWTCMLAPLVVFFMRAGWPFAPEILALERCKLRKRNQKAITYASRSRTLHRLFVADHVARWIGSCIYGTLLVFMLVGFAMFVRGITRGEWDWAPVFDHLVLPVCLWAASLYFAVFRFLSYLDNRIRLEGWEIELRLKAEAGRLERTIGSFEAEVEKRNKDKVDDHSEEAKAPV